MFRRSASRSLSNGAIAVENHDHDVNGNPYKGNRSGSRLSLGKALLLTSGIALGYCWFTSRSSYIRKTILLDDGTETYELPDQICILNPNEYPEEWRAPDGLELPYYDPGTPWTAAESEMAEAAAERALTEMVDFYQRNMTHHRIRDLSTDSVNSLIDETYASTNMPAYHRLALMSAARNLKIVAAKHDNEKKRYSDGCDSARLWEHLKYVGYGQYLLNSLTNDKELAELQKVMVKRVNLMFAQCDWDLEKSLEIGNLRTIFKDKRRDPYEVWHWMSWIIAITEGKTVKGLKLPRGTDKWIAETWEYFLQYEFRNARDSKELFRNEDTKYRAWLSTHIAYIPTGYGRHKQYIEDHPALYRYIRENFYYALEYGFLDLVCEFIDLVRQYGCTEENDYQVRHGARFVLQLYEQSGRSWLAYRHGGNSLEEDSEEELDDYQLIHKPWTATAGLVRRDFEPVNSGSYGEAFQHALKRAGFLKKKAKVDKILNKRKKKRKKKLIKERKHEKEAEKKAKKLIKERKT